MSDHPQNEQKGEPEDEARPKRGQSRGGGGAHRAPRANPGTIGVRHAFRVFAPFARPHWKAIVLAVVLVLSSTVVGLLRPWPLKFLFDDVLITSTPAPNVEQKLLVIALALLGIAGLDALLGYLRSYVLFAIGQKVALRIRTRLYEQMQHLSLTFHDRHKTGDLLTRVTKDVDKVQALVTDNIVVASSNLLTLVGMVVVMFVLDVQLTLAMLLVLPVLLAANAWFRSRIRTNEQSVRSQEGDITSIAQEVLSSIRIVKTFGRERYESDRFREANDRSLGANLRVMRIEGAFSAAIGMLTAAALAGLVWFGAHRVLSGALSVGELTVFVDYVRQFYGPMRSLAKLQSTITRTGVRAEKISSVLEEQSTVRELPDATEAPPLQGHLEFREVSFGYVPGRPVLHSISFEARAGEVIALVGATGAGKSTIAGLVPRLYDPDEGAVLIDGHDVREFTLASLQAQIGFVLQNPTLFATTVRENIAYGRPDASFEQIVASAKAANAHDFILDLPEGYETVLGERGDTLSGGQRQRIAIARALVRDTPILILDEPTTGLDARSERSVLDALDRLMVGRTTIVIAHKLSSVRQASQILLVDAGRVLERGSHAELMAAGGSYAQLVRLQEGLVIPSPSRQAAAAQPGNPWR